MSKASSVICAIALAALCAPGCINIERVRYGPDWPPIGRIERLEDIEGVYENEGDGAGDRLWGFLTKKRYVDGDTVQLRVVEHANIEATLFGKDGPVETVVLKRGPDFHFRRGIIKLPTERGLAVGALGTGIGYCAFRVYRTQEGDLAGVRKGAAAGFALHFIPTIGFGADWNYWRQNEHTRPTEKLAD